jgi:hypothetical protein
VSCLSANPLQAHEIADVAGCSESTLQNAYRLLWEVRYEIGKDLTTDKSLDHLPCLMPAHVNQSSISYVIGRKYLFNY